MDIYARLSFWYHLGFAEISHMPLVAIRAYHQRLPSLQSELRLMLADAASIPHVTGQSRKRIIETWARIAFGAARKAPIAPPALLGMMGIGVERAHQGR